MSASKSATPASNAATPVFLLHWNSRGPKFTEVLRFQSRHDAETYASDCLPGDRTAHVVGSTADLENRFVFRMATLSDVYTAITKNNSPPAFNTLDTARELVYRELVRQFGNMSTISTNPTPPTKPSSAVSKRHKSMNDENTTAAEAATDETATITTVPAFLITLTDKMVRIRSFAAVDTAQAAMRGQAMLVTKPSDLDDMSMEELVRLYNSTKPETEVKSKFASKAVGIEKLWDRMQAIPHAGQPAPRKAPKVHQPGALKPVRESSSLGTILKLMLAETYTLDQIVERSGVTDGEVIDAKAKVAHRIKFVLPKSHGIGHTIDENGVVHAVVPEGIDTEALFAKAA